MRKKEGEFNMIEETLTHERLPRASDSVLSTKSS
jgi:hypothetical protein